MPKYVLISPTKGLVVGPFPTLDACNDWKKGQDNPGGYTMAVLASHHVATHPSVTNYVYNNPNPNLKLLGNVVEDEECHHNMGEVLARCTASSLGHILKS